MVGWCRLTVSVLCAAPLALLGCGSDSGGDTGLGGDAGIDGGGKSCVVSSDCDDGNACTLESCASGKCSWQVAPDGNAKEQEEGDCAKTVCKSGIPSQVPDNGDVPNDDEQCTLDTCENGAPFNKPVLENTPCKIGTGAGQCKSGKCLILCTPSTAASQCNDGNGCTDDACVPCSLPECAGQGVCKNQGLSGIPTPGASQKTGDCHERRCVEGKDTDDIDNFDVPVDGNECTEDLCKNGEPANPPVSAGTTCSSSGGVMCDGAGKCVDCVKDSDCDPTSTGSCTIPACKSGSCSSTYIPAGTPLPAAQQTQGDCRTIVCNGSGSTTYQADSTDIQDDQNACTTDSCVGTSPTHTKLPAGTACGSGGQVCNASGTCCGPTSCAAAGKVCGNYSDGCGTTLNCGTCPTGQTCTTAGQCCTPKECVAGISCGSQSNLCGGTITCGTCGAGDTCLSGTCGCFNGVKNGTETDVDCGGVCAKKCGQGLTCLAGSDCTTGYCADGVCCDAACAGTCKACTSIKTGLTTGTCGNVKDATDPDNECPNTLSTTCGTTGMCKAGACEYHAAGTVCAAGSCSGSTQTLADTCNGSGTCVDNGTASCGAGYVCSGAACQSCSHGFKNGAEVDVDCGGSGGCPKCATGKKCTLAADCTSGNCVDGYCCNTACTGTCQSCGLAGYYGTCSPIANGVDPADECPGQKTCNGAGGCT